MLDMTFDILPTHVSQVMLSRGGSLLPVGWFDGPARNGKMLLDQLEDTQLLAPLAVQDESMAAALRGLLYLWCGCAGETEMFAAAAGPHDQLYINALRLRHARQYADSKALFQQLNGHEIHQPLAEAVRPLLGQCADKHVKRFADILNLDTTWEAYAFTDLCEQAHAEQLTSGGSEMVRKLQGIEFNFLFAHCFQGATGRGIASLSARSDRDEPARRRPRRRIETPTRRPNQGTTERPAASETPEAPETSKQDGRKIRLACPGCHHPITTDADRRGEVMTCEKCSGKFRIPGGKPPSGHSDNDIRVACPKCGKLLRYDVSVRGRQVTCDKCDAVFKIPDRKDHAA